MRQLLASVVMGALLAFTTSAALAGSPSVEGTVTQIFSHSNAGTYLIAINGTLYQVPFDIYVRAHVGDVVMFDGTNWTINM